MESILTRLGNSGKRNAVYPDDAAAARVVTRRRFIQVQTKFPAGNYILTFIRAVIDIPPLRSRLPGTLIFRQKKESQVVAEMKRLQRMLFKAVIASRS